MTILTVAAIALTVLISVTSVIRFAYRSPSLHVAVETAAALISLLAAQLLTVPTALLVEHITTVAPERLQELCTALNIAARC